MTAGTCANRYDDGVHFYGLSSQPGAVCQMSCPDNLAPCLPLPPAELLLPLSSASASLTSLLEELPSLLSATKKVDTSLGAGLEACAQLLEGTGGRLIVFQHTLPALPPLELSPRDDTRHYGTEKERHLLEPADERWEAFAKRLCAAQICVSSFHFALGTYVDMASQARRPDDFPSPEPCLGPSARPDHGLGPMPSEPSQAMLARATGGQVYLYPNCVPEKADVWGTRLQAELSRNLSRNFGYEGVMRFRCSKGLCVDEYLMGYPKPGENDVDVPGIDADSAFAVTMRHDEKLAENAQACVQCALLYTTSAGERRIRVLTYALTTTTLMTSLYRYADLDALLNVMMRKAIRETSRRNMHHVREGVVNSCVDMLCTYRKHCASSTAPGQLILPESLKLLPLYTLSLNKTGLLRAGDP